MKFVMKPIGVIHSSFTVSHHLAKLADVGLVTARAEGYYSVYELDRKALEATTRDLFSGERMAAAASGVDAEAYDHKIISDYSLPDGRLKTIPAQRKKLEAILRHVVKTFEPGVRYSEKQVNEILARFHADTATLRRELVGYGLMEREGGGGEYWRAEIHSLRGKYKGRKLLEALAEEKQREKGN